MEEAKNQLRRQFKLKRASLSAYQLSQDSQRICQRLMALDKFSHAKSIHLYEPITQLNEVDISPMSDVLTKLNLKMYTSRKNDGDWQIVDFNSGEAGRYLTPDIVLVPMLAFDNSLNRLGYGGGYYDRLLKDWPKTLKVGVCFELGHFEALPHNNFDVAMDMVVTNTRTYIKA